MARLTKIKNPLLFLDAIKIYNKKRENKTLFLILGHGVLEDEIISYIQKNNLKNVNFLGAIYEPWKYLRTSKVFVSIQQDENYPSQSLLEAMACENAIIASDVGETRKLVTENEGILVNLDAEEIAEAIYKLISDNELCERLGKNARKKAIIDHNIEKYCEYFYKITS
jgi:glycosyltransferase involved in cell wall biosynthesis